MNTQIAQKLADAITVVDTNIGFETVGAIQTGVDLSSSRETARVIVDGAPVTAWVTCDGDTVRAARAIVSGRVDAMYDAADAK